MSAPTVIVGECLAELRRLPFESVQCCVTSPPYWQLRDYKHADQLGLEPTPAQYVERLVAILEEVRRVLRPDGTLWLNLGDTYSSSGHGGPGNKADRRDAWREGSALKRDRTTPPGFRPKQLVGVPWRVALALSDAGWLLRQDIIWAKPNPMPESVTDRCVRSHEHLFLLTKGPHYFFDHKAIREKAVHGYGSGTAGYKPPGQPAHKGLRKPKHDNGHLCSGLAAADRAGAEERNSRDVWTIAPAQSDVDHYAVMPEALAARCIAAGSKPGDTVLDPFLGSGTVAVVAHRMDRKTIGIELNPEYAALARIRLDVETRQARLFGGEP